MRFLWCICVGSLLIFVGLYAVSVLGYNASLQQAREIQIGFCVFAAVVFAFGYLLHGGHFQNLVIVLVVLMVDCGVVLLYSANPWVGVGAGLVYLTFITILAREEHLDTPYSQTNGPVYMSHPLYGEVLVQTAGRTPRQVKKDIKARRARL